MVIGYDLNDTDRYIRETALDSSIEIDNHVLGKPCEFKKTYELASFLEMHQINNQASVAYLSLPAPAYFGFRVAIERRPGKPKIRSIDELSLEMQLLTQDLKTIQEHDKIKLTEIKKFLVDLSSVF